MLFSKRDVFRGNLEDRAVARPSETAAFANVALPGGSDLVLAFFSFFFFLGGGGGGVGRMCVNRDSGASGFWMCRLPMLLQSAQAAT